MKQPQAPSVAFLPAPKASAECLSHRQVARIAAGATTKDAFAAHLSTCSMCNDRLAVEVRAFAADARRDVPVELMRALREAQERQAQPRWRLPIILVPSLAVMALAVVFVLRVGVPEQNTLKGGTAILASVKRNGALVLEDREAQTLEDLQPGDQLSIHVVGKPHQMAYVQVDEEGVWKDYYRGEVPKDGWLPVGLEVTAGAPTHVRIAVCDSARMDGTAVENMASANCTRAALEL